MKRTIPTVPDRCRDCGAVYLRPVTPVVPTDMWVRFGGRCARCFTKHQAAFDVEVQRRWPEVQRVMAKQGLH